MLFLQTFLGNQDENTSVTNQFQSSMIAKCVRVNPLAWNHHIAMRLDLMGCPVVTTTTTPSTSTSTTPTVVTTTPQSTSTSTASTVATTKPQSPSSSTTSAAATTKPQSSSSSTTVNLKASTPGLNTNKAKLTATPGESEETPRKLEFVCEPFLNNRGIAKVFL